MSGDDIGLNFFTENSGPPSSPKPSAFGPVDQGEMIRRLDAVDDDDLSSTFFDDSIADVENAATRAFDIGIRMHGTDPDPADLAPPLTTESIDASPPPAADAVELPVIGRLAGDDTARAAFILGGPGGLK